MVSRFSGCAVLGISLCLMVHSTAGCSGKHNPGLDTGNGAPAFATHPPLANVLAELDSLEVPPGVEPSLFEALKREFATQWQAADSAKHFAGPPTAEQDRITSLQANDNGDGTFTLSWPYKSSADYDQNGEVNVSDITPIVIHFGATSDDANWQVAKYADGDGNGEVNTADITPIVVNYGTYVAGYNIQTSPTADGTFTDIDNVGWEGATGAYPTVFNATIPLAVGEWVSVVPVDSGGTPGQQSNATQAVQWFDDFTFEVTWQPDTTVVEQEQLGLLTSYDLETGQFTFDATGVVEAGLDISVGRVLMIYGIALGRVTDVQTAGNDLFVQTEYAALTDAISDGTIAWDYGVDFRPERLTSIIVDGERIASQDVNPINEFEFESGGYTYKLALELDNQFCWVSLEVSKGGGATITGKFTAEGFIERFRTVDNIVIAGGVVQQFDHSYEGMRGDLLLELIVTAGTATTDEFINLKLPWTVLEYTFLVGYVPVTVRVKLQVVMNLFVPVAGSAWVDVGFSYDSDIGLSYNGTNVGATGNAGVYSFEEGTHQTGAPSPIVANFGIGFPRVELALLGDLLVPWGQTAFLIEGNFTPFSPALQEAKVAYIGAIGYKLDILGLFGIEGSLTVWNEEETIFQAGETE